jgi:hypothetical protein
MNTSGLCGRNGRASLGETWKAPELDGFDYRRRLSGN